MSVCQIKPIYIMTNNKTQKFIKSQIMQLRNKIRNKKEELKVFLDTSYNFSMRANVCKDAILYYENRITNLENEEEYNK